MDRARGRVAAAVLVVAGILGAGLLVGLSGGDTPHRWEGDGSFAIVIGGEEAWVEDAWRSDSPDIPIAAKAPDWLPAPSVALVTEDRGVVHIARASRAEAAAVRSAFATDPAREFRPIPSLPRPERYPVPTRARVAGHPADIGVALHGVPVWPVLVTVFDSDPAVVVVERFFDPDRDVTDSVAAALVGRVTFSDERGFDAWASRLVSRRR